MDDPRERETPEAEGRRRYYEAKSTGYFSNNARTDRIASLVGGPGLRVLDVACGSGHIGARLRSRGNYVVGCEIAQAAADEARKVFDEVHAFDIEATWPEAVRSRPFDVVVLGEILEHVFDPVGVLSQARSVLAPSGRVVITTPNFLVWIARLQILFGRFRYQKYGLFDFGHIRWFTHAYLMQVLHDAGFSLEAERHILHPARLEPIVSRWPSLFALHFVVSARARP